MTPERRGNPGMVALPGGFGGLLRMVQDLSLQLFSNGRKLAVYGDRLFNR
jgi:hypothetical protein